MENNSENPSKENITSISISDEMKKSYLDYAMSVIVSRALPDVRDGLKPVHRRILYAMYKGGYDWSKPYRKSARIEQRKRQQLDRTSPQKATRR